MINRLFLSFFLFAYPLAAVADNTIDLDAGQLTGPSGGSPTMTTGGLLLLLDLGSSGAISNVLTVGQYSSGTNFVVAAANFSLVPGETQETNSVFSITSGGGAVAGDVLALRWFPQITYSQYLSGTLPSLNEYYGTYTPSSTSPPTDGGSAWLVPSGSGGTYYLDFYTVNSSGGGNEAAMQGYAMYQVQSVPEPSAWALLLVGVPMLAWLGYRQKSGGLRG